MKLVNFIKKHSQLLSFVLSFLVILIALILSTDFFSDVKFYWDSNYYLELSRSFLNNGSFSFVNYPLSIRGYLWPFIIFIFSNTLNIFGIGLNTSTLLMVAIFYAFSFSVSLPKVISYLFKTELSSCCGILITFIVTVYWIGLVRYPLTDLYSFCLVILLIQVFMTALREVKPLKTMLLGIMIGALSYAIYNARSSVGLFSVVLISVTYLVQIKKWKYKGILIVAMAMGVLLIGTPQIMINNHYGKGANLELHADNYNGSGESLVLYQLRLGITHNRYDTLVEAARERYQTDAYIEFNQAGVNLLDRYQLVKLDSYIQYMKLVIVNPIDFINIYANHFETMLDARYGEIYIEKYDNRFFKLFINYAIWTFALIVFVRNAIISIKNRQFKLNCLNHRSLIIFSIILPSILAFPGVPEYRFFLPIYMFVYMIIIVEINDIIKNNFRKN